MGVEHGIFLEIKGCPKKDTKKWKNRRCTLKYRNENKKHEAKEGETYAPGVFLSEKNTDSQLTLRIVSPLQYIPFCFKKFHQLF